MELPGTAFDSSVLIVAHPDDEILWFSSIIDRVDSIVICYMDAGHSVELGEARRKALTGHACAARITLLDLAQSKSHNMSRWPDPEEASYGLRLSKNAELDKLHVEQAQRLRDAISPIVAGSKNVFTHNPWGEYGHEDHVQINRIVSQLAESNGASVWFGNYVSNKSSQLMRSYLQGFSGEYYTMPVNPDHARQVAETYVVNGAWTWIDDYRWPTSECFLEYRPEPAKQGPGAPLPINYLRVPFDSLGGNRRKPGLTRRLRRRLRHRAPN